MSRAARRSADSLTRIADSLESQQTRPDRDTSRGTARSVIVPDRVPIAARVILHFGGRTRRVEEAREARRSYPIMGYVGPNGGGKSLCMVHDTLPTLAGLEWHCTNEAHRHAQQNYVDPITGEVGPRTSGLRLVLSTVRLLGPDGEDHRQYVPFLDFDQLLDAEHCDVLMDEVVGIANSRSAQSLPVQVQNVLVQLRRRDICLRWTAPNWARADKIIREVTQAVTECRGHFPVVGGSDGEGTTIRLWAPNRVFTFRTYDTVDFEEWSAGKREKLDRIAGHWFRGIGCEAFGAYDTLDAVSMVKHGTDDNVCVYCGKQKTVTRCKGHTEDEVTQLLIESGQHTGALQLLEERDHVDEDGGEPHLHAVESLALSD